MQWDEDGDDVPDASLGLCMLREALLQEQGDILSAWVFLAAAVSKPCRVSLCLSLEKSCLC